MNNALFAQIPSQPQNISNFKFDWTNTLTLKMGKLTPIMCKEVLPGDSWHGEAEIFMRFMPLYAPVMHKVNVFTHYFYVPSRILWNYDSTDCFDTFLTGGRTGNETLVPPICHLNASVEDSLGDIYKTSSLADYLGINIQHLDWPVDPTTSGYTFDFSLLPVMAYQSICDEWYRNKNLSDSYFNEIRAYHSGGYHALKEEFNDEKGVLRSYLDLFSLRSRTWEADYFTSALPWPQRGDDVAIPFMPSPTSGYPIYMSEVSKYTRVRDYSNGTLVNDVEALGTSSNGNLYPNTLSSLSNSFVEDVEGVGTPLTDLNVSYANALSSASLSNVISGHGLTLDLNGSHTANLSTLRNSATIRDLRMATLQERFAEISANTIPDYKHFINAFFDVVVPDYRLQLPEFVGGGRQPVTFSEVLQTSASEVDSQGTFSPQGNMSGHGISIPQNSEFNFTAPEHGYIIGIMSVVPRTVYCQGIHRMYHRDDKFDYYLPLFETLPMQAVKNHEIYATGSSSSDAQDFGYQPRFMEYKFSQNELHGDFKSSMSYWTLARLFDNLPSLNNSFVTSDPSTRIFNVDDGEDPDATDKIVAMVSFRCNVNRHMSVYSKID